MRSPWQLTKESWQLFKSNFVLLLKYWLMSIGIGLSALLVGGLIAFALVMTKIAWLAIILVIPAVIVVIVLGAWLGAANLAIIRSIIQKAPLGVKAALSWGWQNKGKYFGTTFLLGLVILGGILLFIIPVFIFGVMLTFTLPVLAFEGKYDSQAMGRSRELVKNRFWKTAGYISVPLVVGLIISIVTASICNVLHIPKNVTSGIQQTIHLFVTLPFLFYQYLLYQDYVANPEVKK